MPAPHRLERAFVAAFTVLALLRAQEPVITDPRAVWPERLCVKLAEGSGAELRDGALCSRTGTDLSSVAAIFAQAEARPLITCVSWDVLDEWHTKACAVLPANNRPGHLGLWFHLTCESPETAARLRDQLRANPLVACLHHEPRLALARWGEPAADSSPLPGGDIPPTTPLLTSLQLTHNPSPQGHGVRRVDGIYGARGQGVRFVMIEESFVLDHEDVCQLTASHFLGPVPPLDMNHAQHGTSGASMVCATRNEYGFTGIADEVDARFIGLGPAGGFENALAFAVTQTQPADVILVVLIVQVPLLGPGSWVPLEFFQAAFDATLTTTALGRLVVVPGGNGDLSLDDPALLNRFDRNFRDSGAIIVGASAPGPLVRAPFSNWGSRIDAHSWGDGVASCGYPGAFFPNNDLLQAYTAGASGTSASTPQVAGVVAAIEGVARAQLGAPLTNQQVLALLHAYGPDTPDVIGRRPDLEAIFAALGVLDGLAVDEPDFDLLETIGVTMDGAPGSIAALFASFAAGDVDLGLDRHVLIDLTGMVSIGAFVLPAGTATYSLPIPNSATLHGVSLYFQAVRLTGSSPLHVTNSCQATIR
jgi:microbial collagenase